VVSLGYGMLREGGHTSKSSPSLGRRYWTSIGPPTQSPVPLWFSMSLVICRFAIAVDRRQMGESLHGEHLEIHSGSRHDCGWYIAPGKPGRGIRWEDRSLCDHAI
jgi:hypothetical protein